MVEAKKYSRGALSRHLAARESRLEEGRVPRGFQQARPLISIIITSLYVFEPVDLRCRVAQLMRIGAAYISGRCEQGVR